jgi:O-antigen/teichoic acid export membrane protein
VNATAPLGLAIIRRIRDFFRDRFTRDIAILASGNIAGQSIQLAAAPVLMRLYTPADYGLFSVYFAILSFLLVNASLRFEFAIPVARSRRQLLSVVAVGSVVLCAWVVLLVAGLAILSLWRPNFLAAHPEWTLAWVLPASVGIGGMNNLLAFYATREMAFRDLQRTRVTQSVLATGAQLGLFFLGMGAAGLIVGDTVGRSAGLLRLSRPLWGRWREYPGKIGVAEIMAAARRYSRFAVFSAPAASMNSAAAQLPSLAVVGIYGPEAAGWYGQAHRLMIAPLSLIGQAISRAFLAHFSDATRKATHELLGVFRRGFKRLAIIGTGPILGVSLLAPFLVPMVFGEQWRPAGNLMLILSPFYLIQFFVWPLSGVLLTLERQRLQAVWDCGRLILVLGVFGAAVVASLSLNATMGMYAGAMAISYIVLYFLAKAAIQDRQNQ